MYALASHSTRRVCSPSSLPMLCALRPRQSVYIESLGAETAATERTLAGDRGRRLERCKSQNHGRSLPTTEQLQGAPQSAGTRAATHHCLHRCWFQVLPASRLNGSGVFFCHHVKARSEVATRRCLVQCQALQLTHARQHGCSEHLLMHNSVMAAAAEAVLSDRNRASAHCML
eukprot:SAG11_NODE_5544_length_1530_cov_1.982530_2_plen_173_part_00